jgi:hypothetical protein
MDEREIKYFFKNQKNFIGVFPCDSDPGIKRRPCGVIFNLDPHWLPGSHWVAVYFGKQWTEYFDPFGDGPPDIILNYMRKYSKVLYYSSFEIQAKNSDYCGLFAVNYLKNRLAGRSFESIINSFSPQQEINDYLV